MNFSARLYYIGAPSYGEVSVADRLRETKTEADSADGKDKGAKEDDKEKDNDNNEADKDKKDADEDIDKDNGDEGIQGRCMRGK